MFIDRKMKRLGVMIFLLAAFQLKAEVTFTPAEPVVSMGENITLSVSGTVGELTWSAQKGQIEGTGTTVNYIAPFQPKPNVVTVMDAEANVATVKIQINAKPKDFSPENAVWEVFTNRDEINALALSKDNTTLWVGTEGGLEKRNASTGELEKVYLNTDGLPNNNVTALSSDDQGGVWIGTEKDGLVHLKADGSWQVFNTDNSKMPNNNVQVLLSDARGVWIGSFQGIAHLKADGSWQVFNTDNSKMPNNFVLALLSDGQRGVWVGTNGGGLANLKAEGSWQVFNTDNSNLPYNYVYALISDAQGGVWVGTNSGGLAYLKADGSWQVVFETDNSNLLDNYVNALISDAQGGVWVGTSEDSLAHLKADGSWQVFNTDNSKMPHNQINALFSDVQEGVWVGTNGGGLAHLKADGSWQVFNTDNSNLPDNYVTALFSDEQEGVWVGTPEGLAHLKADGSWEVFKTDNSNLPDNYVHALLSDEQGGVWIGTYYGLVHFKADGSWQVFNTDNSNLLHDFVFALISDEQGGVWIGTYGLAHFKADGSWQTFINTEAFNSNLPDNYVYVKALLSDAQGGVWVGTSEDSLAHLKADRSWQVFNKDNSNLPDNSVEALLSDEQGGVWVGTGLSSEFGTAVNGGGLARLKADGSWQIFNEDNSKMPGNYLTALFSDHQGGIWIGTSFDGLAHLTFGQKSTLCTYIEQAECHDVITADRAAILIHPNGSGSGSNQELAIDFMATYAYHSLQARGYDNDEIYFLSYKPDLDFNGDAQADVNIVDAPVSLAELRNGTSKPRDITLEDTKKAFEWAESKGKLEHPLIVIFVDHGLPNTLLLDPLGTETLTADTFKALLDDYQNSTDNQVVVILEACHSGTFVPTLSAPNRLIISSTDEELAYFSDKGRTSFLKLYFDNLRQGESFGESLKQVTDALGTYSWPLNQQRPQLNNNTMAQNLCLNGCWGGLPGVLTLLPQIPSGQINLGQPIDLTVQTSITSVGVRQVWASIMTPEIANQRNEQGYSLLPAPLIFLTSPSTNTRNNDEKWQGSFSELTLPGDYVVTFKAKDNNGFITDAPPVILTVVGEGLTHARFDATTKKLHIPAVTVGTDIYQADLLLRQFEPEIILEVDMNSLKIAENTTSVGYSNFSPKTGEVYIPLLEVPNTTGDIDTYSVNLQLEPQTSSLQFKVKAIK